MGPCTSVTCAQWYLGLPSSPVCTSVGAAWAFTGDCLGGWAGGWMHFTEGGSLCVPTLVLHIGGKVRHSSLKGGKYQGRCLLMYRVMTGARVPRSWVREVPELVYVPAHPHAVACNTPVGVISCIGSSDTATPYGAGTCTSLRPPATLDTWARRHPRPARTETAIGPSLCPTCDGEWVRVVLPGERGALRSSGACSRASWLYVGIWASRARVGA